MFNKTFQEIFEVQKETNLRSLLIKTLWKITWYKKPPHC